MMHEAFLYEAGLDTPQAAEARRKQRDVIDSYYRGLEEWRTDRIEQVIRLGVQPKPQWLPDFVWKKLIARIVRVEIEASK